MCMERWAVGGVAWAALFVASWICNNVKEEISSPPATHQTSDLRLFSSAVCKKVCARAATATPAPHRRDAHPVTERYLDCIQPLDSASEFQ